MDALGSTPPETANPEQLQMNDLTEGELWFTPSDVLNQDSVNPHDFDDHLAKFTTAMTKFWNLPSQTVSIHEVLDPCRFALDDSTNTQGFAGITSKKIEDGFFKKLKNCILHPTKYNLLYRQVPLDQQNKLLHPNLYPAFCQELYNLFDKIELIGKRIEKLEDGADQADQFNERANKLEKRIGELKENFGASITHGHSRRKAKNTANKVNNSARRSICKFFFGTPLRRRITVNLPFLVGITTCIATGAAPIYVIATIIVQIAANIALTSIKNEKAKTDQCKREAQAAVDAAKAQTAQLGQDLQDTTSTT